MKCKLLFRVTEAKFLNSNPDSGPSEHCSDNPHSRGSQGHPTTPRTIQARTLREHHAFQKRTRQRLALEACGFRLVDLLKDVAEDDCCQPYCRLSQNFYAAFSKLYEPKTASVPWVSALQVPGLLMPPG